MGRSTKIRNTACIALLYLYWQATPAFGDVLHDHDNGPLTGIFGIPDSTEGGFVAAAGKTAWSLNVSTSSHSITNDQTDESLQLDGETTRYEFRYRYGLADRLEIGVELPYVQHNPGRLDSVIDAWHGFFGLPDGIRPQQPQDELQFSYTDSNSDPLTVTQQSRGAGDLRLFAGWQLTQKENSATAIRFGVKFPTGDSENLHGSGGTDLSLGIAGDGNKLWGLDRLNGFYRAGAVYVGQPQYLADRSVPLIGYLSSGLGYFLTDWFELRVQGAARSAAYDSDLKNLGDPSITLTFGGNFTLGKSYELSLGVGEDINVATAPDVTFLLALRYRAN